MEWNIMFFFNSVLLGAGLAMDAFSVSLANGLHEPKMRYRKMIGIAGVFGAFQAFMPMVGWICVHTILQYFQAFEKWIPWIALVLLAYIGGSMLLEGLKGEEEFGNKPRLGIGALLIQGIATSIDALSVGFAIAGYGWWQAFVCSGIIAVVTFVLCMAGLIIGRKFGTRYAGKASILGGVILIGIGVEIFLSNVVF